MLLLAATRLTILYEKELTIPPQLSGKYVQLDGIKLRFHQAGQGADVLFLHGSIGSLEDFETVMSQLVSRYRVTTFDRIGHGYNDMT